MRQDIARIAARNNAAWCDLVARSHGVPGRFDDDAWTCSQRTPPYYPDAVTLTADVDVPALLARLDTSSPGCSVKDSFGTIDLSSDGFTLLVDAEWIALPAAAAATLRGAAPPAGPGLTWAQVTEPAALATWEDAWRGIGGPHGLFRDQLVDDDSVAVLAGHRDGHIRAGAIVNRAGGAVGVSNVFTPAGVEDATWFAVIILARRLFPGLPLVGYESGDDLAAPRRHGFRSVGPLRVWLSTVG